MDPLPSLTQSLSVQSATLWAGISSGLAIFLLLTQFARMIRTQRIAAARQRALAQERSTPRWAPTMTSGDRRRRYRRSGNPVSVQLVGVDGNRQFNGRIMDRSQGGL